MRKLTCRKEIRKTIPFLSAIILTLLSGCVSQASVDTQDSGADTADSVQETTQEPSEDTQQEQTDSADPVTGESAADGEIDFEALKAINPDIFGWIYIPDAGVDQPLLQHEEDDLYYATHDAAGGTGGSAPYTEFPNRTDFCDFNEVIYCVDGEYIHSLTIPDNFDKAGDIEIFIDGNHLTYEVVMARKWERIDLLTQYAFPSPQDAENFIRDCKDTMSLSDNISSGFDELTCDDFLITLIGYPEGDSTSQYMVIARLIEDEQGTIRTPQGEIPGITF